MNSYYDELQFVRDSPDEIFPEFLFKALTNDFDEDYYARGASDNPLDQKARQLRKKYSSYFEYLDAIEIYNEYINELIEKYGSWYTIKNSAKLGLLEETIPSKPRLKNKKANREFMRSGVVPSRKIDGFIRDVSYVDVAREEMPDKFGEDIEDSIREKKPPKELRKIIESSKSKIAAKSRKENIYSSAGNRHGSELIIEFLTQASKGMYDNMGEIDGKNLSFAQMVKEDERRERIPIEILDLESENQTTFYNGRLVKTSEIRQIELIKCLYEAGIDMTGTLNKSMTKQAVKMVRRSIGAYDSEPMTKKELKKFKKNAKKEQKKLDKRADYDQILSSTLLKNKVSFDKKGSSLSFRLRDIYNDE